MSKVTINWDSINMQDAISDFERFTLRRLDLNKLLHIFKTETTVQSGQELLAELHSINQDFPNAFSADTIKKVEIAIAACEKNERT